MRCRLFHENELFRPFVKFAAPLRSSGYFRTRWIRALITSCICCHSRGENKHSLEFVELAFQKMKKLMWSPRKRVTNWKHLALCWASYGRIIRILSLFFLTHLNLHSECYASHGHDNDWTWFAYFSHVDCGARAMYAWINLWCDIIGLFKCEMIRGTHISSSNRVRTKQSWTPWPSAAKVSLNRMSLVFACVALVHMQKKCAQKATEAPFPWMWSLNLWYDETDEFAQHNSVKNFVFISDVEKENKKKTRRRPATHWTEMKLDDDSLPYRLHANVSFLLEQQKYNKSMCGPAADWNMKREKNKQKS